MFFLTAPLRILALHSQIRQGICLIWLLHGSLFMWGLASECLYDPPPCCTCILWLSSACAGCVWLVNFFFYCVLKCVSLPLWKSVSKIIMRCQLDSFQRITGCTLGVSVSLTHSHMLFPVLIFQLGRVMLASHSMRSLSLHLLYLSRSLTHSFSLSLHLCSLDVAHLSSLFVNLNFASWNICLRFSRFHFHLSLHHPHSHHAG